MWVVSSNFGQNVKKILEGNKGIIRSRKSKKDRQHNDKKKNNMNTNTDLQNIIRKTEDRATGTPLKLGSEPRCSGRVTLPSPHVLRCRMHFY